MILRSKLHSLNKNLLRVSLEVCTGALWPGSKNLDIKIGLMKRVMLIELKRLIEEILTACKDDNDFENTISPSPPSPPDKDP